MWIVFTVLSVVFFIIFLLSVFLGDRPAPTHASRQFNPLRGVADWGTRQAIKHATQEQAWQNTQANYERTQHFIAQQQILIDQKHSIEVRSNQLAIEQQDIAKADIDRAKAEGTSVQIIQERRQLELQHGMELKKLEETMRLELQKIREAKEIDFQYFQKETNERVDAALRLQLLSSTQARHILLMLVSVKAELYKLLISKQPADLVEAQAKDYKRFIEGMEVKLGRLIQGDTGQDAGGSDSASIS